jgi:hypothetical protein
MNFPRSHGRAVQVQNSCCALLRTGCAERRETFATSRRLLGVHLARARPKLCATVSVRHAEVTATQEILQTGAPSGCSRMNFPRSHGRAVQVQNSCCALLRTAVADACAIRGAKLSLCTIAATAFQSGKSLSPLSRVHPTTLRATPSLSCLPERVSLLCS